MDELGIALNAPPYAANVPSVLTGALAAICSHAPAPAETREAGRVFSACRMTRAGPSSDPSQAQRDAPRQVAHDLVRDVHAVVPWLRAPRALGRLQSSRLSYGMRGGMSSAMSVARGRVREWENLKGGKDYVKEGNMTHW